MTSPPTAIRPLILCGGAGTRLWPASRGSLPKQFLKLFGPRSTLQDTLLRVAGDTLFGRPMIVTHRDYRFLVREQLDEIGLDADIVLEPHRRDSAPAIAAAAALVAAEASEALALVLAADHVIADRDAFVATCRAAAPAAAAGAIVTFGVTPDRPETAYGYILPGEALEGAGPARRVAAFVEKPDRDTAARYVAEAYLWNSGNFLFRVDGLLAEYRRHDPASADAVAEAVAAATTDLGFLVLDPAAFAGARRQSIDYAVMEHTRHAAVIEASYDWSDVGGWNAVWALSEHDRRGNAQRGAVTLVDTDDCYVAADGRIVALLGVRDLVVVAEPDAVLVADRSRSESLRQLVETLREGDRPEADTHARIHRPWGSYQGIDRGDRFQVKRIVVKPAGRLSLQKHMHRAEHWIVVRGVARVTIDGAVRDLHENESVYVPLGCEHRLENPGRIPLELIEVQTGSYLGEDDIVRVEDDYRRGGGD